MNDVVKHEDRPAHPMVQFKKDLEAVVTRELDMLDDKAKSRMKSAAIVAVTKDPDLLLADRASFVMALRMCAAHGVIPDGNEAVLQTYNTKVKGPNGQDQWIKKVTYLPMIRGIINRVRKSGKVDNFYAEVVYQGERFVIDTSHGDRRPVHDYDPLDRGAGDVIGAYSVVKYTSGVIDCEVMPRKEIEKVKAVAKTKNVWDGWFDEKAKVSVMKRHSKRLPLSAEDMDFIMNREETDFEQARDVTPKPARNLAQQIMKPITPEPEDISQDPADHGEVEDAQEIDAPHWTEEIDTSNAFPGSDAFTAGEKAFRAGMKRTMCPADGSEADKAEWLAGFDGARRAAE